MLNRLQHKTCADLIAQITLCYQRGELTEATELFELLESEANFEISVMDEIKLTMLKGLIKLKQGEYRLAEENLLRSLELANRFGDTRLRYNRYDNLVALYITTNQIHNAIDYLRRSMELKESAGNEADMARSLIQMSSLLTSIEDLDDVRNTLQKANLIIEKLNDPELKMQYHFAYASLLSKEKKLNEAIGEFDEILIKAESINDSYLTSQAYFNQGELYKELRQWDNAEQKYEKALSIARQHNFIVQELLVSVQLASVALQQNNIKKCRRLFDWVSKHQDLPDDDTLKEDLAEVGARLYEMEGEPQKALESYRSYMQSYKKHYDNEQSKVILYIKARYENERKERELQETKLKQMESEMKALMSEKALRESEKRFKAWIENGTDMVVIFKEDMRPAYTSPYIFKSFGYSKEDFAKTSPFDLIHPEDNENVLETIQIARENPGIAVSAQFRFKEKAGKYRWIESNCTNLLHDESVKGIVCNLKDITERKQSEEAIQELNKSLELKITERTSELQDAIKDLEAFSYSVSHDLRSPLRIITGYAKLLISDHEQFLNEESKEFIHTILDNAKRMSQLIDDLLNFSRMGRKAVYKSQVEMNYMVNNIISDFRLADQTITKNIIVHELSPAFCDLALIKQVWANLISNAIKYSSKKTNPVIEIGSIDSYNETIYYVKDNGAGFDMRFAKNLFTVFKRLHDRSDFDGMGVGLALSHRIIKMHEGRIWAEAEVEKGATFYFSLGRGE